MDKITIVIPCYNEQETIPFLKTELYKLIDSMKEVEFEVIMVDNSSNDNTLSMMKELKSNDDRFHYISFSKNFGKDSSMYAGLKASTGDYVVIMDADGQDPPMLIKDMYNILKNEDYDIVAAFRENREGEPFFRSLFAKWFYNLMNKISDSNMVNGARDFRLMKRKVVDAVISLEESQRFTKGIFSWVGFKTKWLPYKNIERVAGKTKLPMASAFSYAIRGIVSFSTAPLFIASIIGFSESIKYLNEIGISNIEKKEKELRKYLINELEKIPYIKIYNKDCKGSIVLINIDGILSGDLGLYLNTKGICVRSGKHCAKMGDNKEDTVRISLYFYNTFHEIDYLINVLKNKKEIEEFSK